MSKDFTSKSQITGRYKKLADGGEAEIYDYDSSHVLKIFKSNVDIKKKMAKVMYFIAHKSRKPDKLILPLDAVTIGGKFAGYIMLKLKNVEDLHMLIKKKYLAINGFTNKDVLQIVTSIGNDLKEEIHDKGYIVGDISDTNFQMKGRVNYFIDTDSWGLKGKFSPDAYTELFTCPDSYNSDGTINFSLENDYYAFAVLAFYMLTRIHPFGGTYIPDSSMSMLTRMEKKISIIGSKSKDIKIPKNIGSWKWMSPQLLQAFKEIFEDGKRMDISPLLQELLDNLKYCNNHNIYYYSKFSECPICNQKAKVSVAPTIIKSTSATSSSKAKKIAKLFISNDCVAILSTNHYLNSNGEMVHVRSGRKVPWKKGTKVDFSDDGQFVYVLNGDYLEIYDSGDKLTSTLERSPNTNYLVRGKDLYYVDTGNNLIKVTVDKNGNIPVYLGKVYNPLIGASNDSSNYFSFSRYNKKGIIKTKDYTFEIKYTGKIRDYAIKYDRISHKWLFAYRLPNGKFRTMIFYKDKILYDDDNILYNADTLGNIDFCNDIIYDPTDGAIIGINVFKNVAKQFTCSVVDEESKLKLTRDGFKIFNNGEIYNFG